MKIHSLGRYCSNVLSAIQLYGNYFQQKLQPQRDFNNIFHFHLSKYCFKYVHTRIKTAMHSKHSQNKIWKPFLCQKQEYPLGEMERLKIFRVHLIWAPNSLYSTPETFFCISPVVNHTRSVAALQPIHILHICTYIHFVWCRRPTFYLFCIVCHHFPLCWLSKNICLYNVYDEYTIQ